MQWMKAGLCALVLLPLGGCASEEEASKVLQEMVDAFNDLAGVLRTVKDQTSAKAAEPKLDAVFDKLKEIKTRDRKVSQGTMNRLKQKFEGPMTQAVEKVGSELERLQRVPGTDGVMQKVQTIVQWTQSLQ